MKTIATLIYPDVMSLDVTGPLQVFASANVECERQGVRPHYQLRVLGEKIGPVATSAGIQFIAELAWRDVDPRSLDTLLIPGGIGQQAQCRNHPLLTWLNDAEPHIRRLGSVCSGALILSAAGLLDGLRATTHWSDMDELARNTKIHVDTDCLHTYRPEANDGSHHLFTSAGVTAGIDLSLALVEADLGRPMALAVARRLVMFLRRPGGQAQFSALLLPDANRTPRLLTLLEWMALNLSADLSLDTLAERMHLSPRSLSRLFLKELGIAPGQYVERLRLEAARALLQDSGASISTIARLSGFRHPENLRRTFQKHFAVSPHDYAARFA
ncbi:GlxA family transcriptional regulator [Pseudomonas matsuisoli]|uniref:AraC family transcriptional regulator n=1 Tax=Pseudomonas matsuisoli TaxID=1515666 RepID=A0A917PMZ0_9PSED|nr:GlxA family transcriptional regulator [Pseudomonas matsuisoli]GGJ85224.1 AraC family transcriptional regulator [Pseudomonas matsuisoli]